MSERNMYLCEKCKLLSFIIVSDINQSGKISLYFKNLKINIMYTIFIKKLI